MEGVGSRVGRASSRYGSAPVLTGPVRRWQKQWVHVSSSSSPISYNFNSRGHKNNLSDIRLRRWTPVPPSHSTTEERPRRKLRYTPMNMTKIENLIRLRCWKRRKRRLKRLILKLKQARQTNLSIKSVMKLRVVGPAISGVPVDPTRVQTLSKGSNKCEVTIRDLNLKGHDEDHGSDRSIEEAEWVKAARTGFAC